MEEDEIRVGDILQPKEVDCSTHYVYYWDGKDLGLEWYEEIFGKMYRGSICPISQHNLKSYVKISLNIRRKIEIWKKMKSE